MARLRGIALSGLVLFSAVALAAPADAELAKWDQARVTGIAQELAEASDTWQQALREQARGEIGEGDTWEETELVNQARRLHEESRALAGHLADGKGHDDTVNVYRSLNEIVDDIEVDAQRSEQTEPVMDAWSKVADLLRQIAPYYDPKALDR